MTCLVASTLMVSFSADATPQPLGISTSPEQIPEKNYDGRVGDAPRVEQVFRAEHGRVFSHLLGAFHDFDVVEDALQDAYVRAMQRWPTDGIPERPGAWILTVARNRIVSQRRHEDVARRKEHALLEDKDAPLLDEDIPDQRARLLFTCCHPALAEPARIALTLRTVCGLSTSAIAALFFEPEATVGQRLSRAKRKIRTTGIPYEIPSGNQLSVRTDDVLACIYLTFTAGYRALEGLPPETEQCAEAIRLARVMVHAFPRHAETRALLALLVLHHARRPARRDEQGQLVALEDQDRTRWDRGAITEGRALLEEALAADARGPYALQAAIAALHADAPTAAHTDWPQIAGLYCELEARSPSPAVSLAATIAESMAEGAAVGLRVLANKIESGLLPADFDRIPAARADMLRRAGRIEPARTAYDEAIACAQHPVEAEFLKRRRDALG